MLTQMFTDTLIRGWQTTHEVNVSGVIYSSFPEKKKKEDCKQVNIKRVSVKPGLTVF